MEKRRLDSCFIRERNGNEKHKAKSNRGKGLSRRYSEN